MPERAARSEPPLEVLRREEAIEETAKLVVVAWVVVELPVMSKLPTMVEEAAVLRKPPERVSKEVVAEPP